MSNSKQGKNEYGVLPNLNEQGLSDIVSLYLPLYVYYPYSRQRSDNSL